MQFKIPKNTEKYHWTQHSVIKMTQYGLSAQRILRVIRAPQRTEKGIVKNTIAVMQPASFKTGKDGKRTWGSEIWAMYQLRKNKAISNFPWTGRQFPTAPTGGQVSKKISKSKFQNSKLGDLMRLRANEANQLKIISAWRYPGVSPKDDPIPEEILRDLENIE